VVGRILSRRVTRSGMFKELARCDEQDISLPSTSNLAGYFTGFASVISPPVLPHFAWDLRPKTSPQGIENL
jgi:hypothetical protein